jgi:phage baseplate assembly protein W
MVNDSSFLGTGWSFPPTFTEGGADVVTVSDAEDIHQSLQILFATTPGERVMQDDYGCDLGRYLFEEIDRSLINSLTALVSDAILFHEPRVTLNNLQISDEEADGGLLLIHIDYTIRSTNSRFNMVYPFYLSEAIPPGGR